MPWEIIREIWRVIMQEGAVYVGVPFIQGFHVHEKCVTDYWRFTHQGIRRLCETEAGFEQVESGEAAGAGSSLAWVLREFLIHFVPDIRWVRGAGALAAAYASFWLRFADRIHRDKTTTVASSVYFIGIKRAAGRVSTVRDP